MSPKRDNTPSLPILSSPAGCGGGAHLPTSPLGWALGCVTHFGHEATLLSHCPMVQWQLHVWGPRGRLPGEAGVAPPSDPDTNHKSHADSRKTRTAQLAPCARE